MSEEPELSLVMPFVVCTSEGGPYEDESFVAGWDLGTLDARLDAGPIQWETVIRS